MRASHTLLFGFVLLYALILSCRKDSKEAGSPQDSLGTLNGCLPTSDSRSVFGEQEIIEYSYDVKGALKQIEIYIEPRKTLVERKEMKYTDTGLLSEDTWTTNINQFGNASRFLIKLLYNNGSKQAENAEFYELTGSSAPQLLKKYTMVRNGNVLQKIVEETPLVSGDIEYTYNFEYTPEGNVSRMVVTPTGNHTPFRYEFGKYDTNPTSVAHIPGAMFINLPITNVLTWATALSKNNPGSVNAIEAKFTIDMAYTYNEKGFPVSREDDVAASRGKYIESHILGYECK